MNYRLDSNEKDSFTKHDFYELFLFFQSLNDLKRKIIMVLGHVYPKKVTINQLAELSGYSSVSKYFHKTKVLKILEEEQMIRIDVINKRIHLIDLNTENPLLFKFTMLCDDVGSTIKDKFLEKLLEERSV